MGATKRLSNCRMLCRSRSVLRRCHSVKFADGNRNMYLSDRDIQWAIERKTLIVNVPEGVTPAKVDPSSIDLRLDHISEAKVWDIDAYKNHLGVTGDDEPILHVGAQKYKIGNLTKF